MKSILLILITAYVLICLVLYFFQRKLLYFPTPEVSLKSYKEISFKNEGLTLQGWVLNEGKDKALIYYGGNAESIELNAPFFEELNLTYTVYLINYRGYGKSQGEPNERALKNDALFIYEELKKRHDSISLMGRSLGSGIATYVAANKPVNKVILVTPYDSILNVAQSFYRLFPISLLLQDQYLSIDEVPKIKAKTLILYAQNDEVIASKHTLNLIKAFESSALKVVLIKEARHNDISLFKSYAQGINSFLQDEE